MLRLETIHNGLVATELEQWTKNKRISGYTTVLIHRSYGSGHGAFQADAVSGDKYLTVIYFGDAEEQAAHQLKTDLSSRGFHTILIEVVER